jgi:hypothetical protein
MADTLSFCNLVLYKCSQVFALLSMMKAIYILPNQMQARRLFTWSPSCGPFLFFISTKCQTLMVLCPIARPGLLGSACPHNKVRWRSNSISTGTPTQQLWSRSELSTFRTGPTPCTVQPYYPLLIISFAPAILCPSYTSTVQPAPPLLVTLRVLLPLSPIVDESALPPKTGAEGTAWSAAV